MSDGPKPVSDAVDAVLLRVFAPRAPALVRQIVANLMANPEASPDALFVVADALRATIRTLDEHEPGLGARFDFTILAVLLEGRAVQRGRQPRPIRCTQEPT